VTSSASQAVRAFLIREQGGLLSQAGDPITVAHPNATAVLSRALCRFALFHAPDNLSGARADKAARLYAEMHAPFPNADYLLIRGVAGYGVWWWDADKVRELVAGIWTYEPSRLVPESLLWSEGETWRQVECAEGFEAQCWRDLTLIASIWRRRPFTGDQWRAFASSVNIEGAPPVGDVPAPETGVVQLSRAAKLPRVRTPLGWRDMERAGLTFIALAGLGACVFLGGAVHYTIMANDSAAQVEALRGEAGANAVGPAALANLDALRQLREQVGRPNPMLVTARAMRALNPFAVTVTGWAVEDNRLRLEILNENAAPVDRIALALEADDWLSEVTVQLDTSANRALFFAEICQSVQRERCITTDAPEGAAAADPA